MERTLHTSELIGMSKLQRNVIHATDQCVCVRVCIVACLPEISVKI